MLIYVWVIKMLYTRTEISKIYNSTYQLNKALKDKKIFKIQNGIYSDEEFVNPLAKLISLVIFLNIWFFISLEDK